MRLLVTGGRDYADREAVFEALDALRPAVIMHGRAKGADSLAHCWALERRVEVSAYGAQWAEHGKAAGPIRNQRMLDEGKPDMVLAFPGGRGTADMVRRAVAANVLVYRWPEDRQRILERAVA